MSPKVLGQKESADFEVGVSVEGDWTDHPALRDNIGFVRDVDLVAQAIINTGTPIVFGIFGPWGAGKTSFMRMLQHRLHSEAVPICWINAWRLSLNEDLYLAFAQTLFKSVYRMLPWSRRWSFDAYVLRDRIRWAQFIRHVAIALLILVVIWIVVHFNISLEIENRDLVGTTLDVLKNVGVPFAGTLLALWVLISPILRESKGWINLNLKSILKDAPFDIQVPAVETLEYYYRYLVRLLGRRVVVFIDDLDRCAPKKIPDVFEAIRHFTHSPGCVYIIGMDFERVKQGIAVRYQFDDADAAEFLEKIFQVQHFIPPLTKAAITELIESCYSWALVPNLVQVIAAGASPNPRRLKRLMNKYRITRQRLPEDYGDPELLAKMVIIEDRFPELYNYLRQSPQFIGELEKEVDLEAVGEQTRGVLLDKFQDLVPGLISPYLVTDLLAMLHSGEARFSSLSLPELEMYLRITATTWENQR